MCMITFVPAGITPGTEQFESIETRTDDAHFINDDGHGFMIATPEGVWANKGMSYKRIFAQYTAALLVARERFGSVPSAFHSRIGTAGPNDQTLCHPFTLDNLGTLDLGGAAGEVNVSTTALMHNGILPNAYQPPVDNKVDSDTSLYVRSVLPMYINSATGVPGRRSAARIAANITSGNKFVIFGSVDGQVRVRVINQDSGTWEDDGAWYSSQYYSRMPAWRSGATYWSGGRSDYWRSAQYDAPIQSERGKPGEMPMNVIESSLYKGWWRRPHEFRGPYWEAVEVDGTPIEITDAVVSEEDADAEAERYARGHEPLALPSGTCTKCLAVYGTRVHMGSQNYCSGCGTCGDCLESVQSCSCLTDTRKPAYAWAAGGQPIS